MVGELSHEAIEKLALKAQKGDEKSFEELFEHFFNKIDRYVRFRVTEEVVEDLVSDVFLRLVKNLKRYRPHPKAKFSSWLFRIAHNRVIDHYRRTKELVGLESEEDNYFLEIPEDENMQPDKVTDRALDHQKMFKLMKKLPALQREILELRYLENFTNAEIAHVVGKSEGNVRVIQLRALREIRKQW